MPNKTIIKYKKGFAAHKRKQKLYRLKRQPLPQKYNYTYIDLKRESQFDVRTFDLAACYGHSPGGDRHYTLISYIPLMTTLSIQWTSFSSFPYA